MEVRVNDRVALVTGASRGIGEATASLLLESGARGVVITGRKPEALDEVAARLGADRAVAVAGNASEDEHAHAAVAAAVERFGSCDILVNNAGTNPGAGSIADVELSAIDKTWSVNLRAPLVFAREAWAQSMRERGGAIVNVGSVGGLEPAPMVGAYNIAKAGLHHLTRQLALEFAPGVRVNAVAAAVVKTKLSRMLWEWDEGAVARAHPLQRLGEPEDVARAIVFLCSDAASWITGTVLTVDGGVSGATSSIHVDAG